MAFTQTDVDTLKAAIATGARRVRMNGEEVEYRSLSEMKVALKMMMDEVAGNAASTTFGVSYPLTSRGL